MAKQTLFIRKDVRNGIHTTTVDGKEIRIANREIYATDDKKIVKHLSDDESLNVYVPDPEVKAVKEYKDMTDDRLVKIAEDRAITDKCENRKELIDILNQYDKENSAPENDQGEQDPK